MTNNLMELDEYKALISYDPDLNTFRGKIIGIEADFYGNSVEELEKEFRISLEVYREVYKEKMIADQLNSRYLQDNVISKEDLYSHAGFEVDNQKIKKSSQSVKTSSYFKEAAAIEMAVLLLTLHGKPMEDIKLMQLMYLVERENILRRGHPITNDEYYATDSGVIMKNIWESLVGNSSDDAPLGNWINSLHCENGFVNAKIEYKGAKLSRAIITVATKVFDEFNQFTVDELRQWMTNPKNLPEWQNPNGFLRPIKITTILRTSDCSEEDIELILEEIALDQSMTMRFSP